VAAGGASGADVLPPAPAWSGMDAAERNGLSDPWAVAGLGPERGMAANGWMFVHTP
jgi:hypothetical protein